MEAANIDAHAFVSSNLDAGNFILYGIAPGQFQCIQITQNNVTRIITSDMNISPQSFINFIGCPYRRGLSSRCCA